MTTGAKKRRAKRKYPKIVLERASVEEILAAHGITERERRFVDAVWEKSKNRQRSAAAK